MRSDSLKVTQIVIEQEPRLPVSKSPVFPGTNPFCLQPVMWHGSCAGEAV